MSEHRDEQPAPGNMIVIRLAQGHVKAWYRPVETAPQKVTANVALVRASADVDSDGHAHIDVSSYPAEEVRAKFSPRYYCAQVNVGKSDWDAQNTNTLIFNLVCGETLNMKMVYEFEVIAGVNTGTGYVNDVAVAKG